MEGDLTKPTPEQFGLSDELVAQLSCAQRERDIQRSKVSMWLGIGLWVTALIYTTYDSTKGFEWGDFLVKLVVFAIIPLWLLPVGLVYGVSYLVAPDPPSYKQLAQYQDAVKRYEAWFIRTQSEFWKSRGGREFEIEVTNQFINAGYNARVTPTTGDQGVDIVLGDGTIVQCKAHKVRISPAVVRDLYGTLQHFNAPKAILISTNGFTKGVIEFVKGKPIELWDINSLITLQRKLER